MKTIVESLLASLAQLQERLPSCADLHMAHAIKNEAHAVQRWARSQGSKEVEIAAAELKIRAYRRMGQLLPPSRKRVPRRATS